MSSHAPDHASHTARRNQGTTARRRRRSRLVALTMAIAVAIIAVDQLTKYIAQRDLSVGDVPVSLVGDLLTLQLIYNSGAALSIGTGMTWVLTIVVVAVIGVIVWAIRRIGSRGWAVALGLLLGGAVGNLVDRLAREPGFGRGHVVDFIGYGSLFVGNVADIAIVAAAIMIGVLAVLGIGIAGDRPGRATPGADADTPDAPDGDEAERPTAAADDPS